jgi:DNA-binding response OmpR family regulator
MSDPTPSNDPPTVLLIEDDRDLADTYSLWLEPEYDVRTAYTGSGGLTRYDSGVDIVLLDRRIPGCTAASIMQHMDQRDVDDQRAFLTSIEPGHEIVDIPCDEYLTKPVTKSKLRETVEELRIRTQLDEDFQRYFTLVSKATALENSDSTRTEMAVQDLRGEAEHLRGRIEDRLSEFDDIEEPFKLLQ